MKPAKIFAALFFLQEFWSVVLDIGYIKNGRSIRKQKRIGVRSYGMSIIGSGLGVRRA